MADEGSAKYPGIRITAVDTFLVAGNCCFVKISTNEGITGLGEGSISDNKVGTIAQCIKDLEGHLIGKNPTDIEYLWQGLYRWNRWHVGVLFSTALSAIDIALWDILGKIAGLPIYKLLGGAARDKVRIYAAGSGKAGVQRARSMGCNAVKTGTASDQSRRPAHRAHALGSEPGGQADRGDAGRRGR